MEIKREFDLTFNKNYLAKAKEENVVALLSVLKNISINKAVELLNYKS